MATQGEARVKTTRGSELITVVITEDDQPIAELELAPEQSLELATALIKAARVASIEED